MEEVEAALAHKNHELKQTNLVLKESQQALAEAKGQLDENLQRVSSMTPFLVPPRWLLTPSW